MSIKHLITITEDFGDSISSDSRVIETPKKITLEDTALLSYIFLQDVTQECIGIEIELLDDVTEQYSHDMVVPFQFVQKIDGIYHFSEHGVPVNDINTEHLSSLMKKSVELFKRLPVFRIKDVATIDDIAFVYDKNRTERLTKQRDRVEPDLKNYINTNKLGDKFISFNTVFSNEQEQHVMVQVLYFPETQEVVEFSCTTIKFNPQTFVSTFLINISFFEKGNLKEDISFESNGEE